MIRRREFITLLGASAAAWPPAARAQQTSAVRRVGVVLSGAESDPAFQAWAAAFQQRLQQLGWIEGRNVRLDVRFSSMNLARMRRNVQELLSLSPNVIVASGAAGTRAFQEHTRTIPIVFVSVGDPVASSVVASIARPEGNTTGFTNLFPSIAGKWLELLREAASHVARVALIFNPDFPAAENYLASIEAAATALAVKAIRTPVRGATEIGSAINAFATESNGGLIIVPPPFIDRERELIVRLANQHRLPTISSDNAVQGHLMSYSPNTGDLYRGAASYVDRILGGAQVNELPVQFPTKFELIVNLKTAKAIGLTIPEAFLLRADEVIE